MSAALLEPENKENKLVDNQKILSMLWNVVEKPKSYLKIKVVNVFDNAYRINVWGEYHDPLHNLNKVKITHSYFCRLYDDGLVVK